MPATRFRALDWYDQPRYYDILLEGDTDVEATFLEAVAARYTDKESVDALEPACGSGRLIRALARRGHRPFGLDLSEPMLDYAAARLAEEGLQAELRHASMDAFRTRRRFDLAYCLVSSFRYLLREDSARAHLSSVADSLRRGGVYVLGLHLTQYDWQRVQRERWTGERDGTRVVCNLQSWPPDRERRLEHLRSRLVVEETGRPHPSVPHGRTDRIETHWDFRTYDARQLRRTLASERRLEHVATYDFTYDLAAPRELNDEQLDCVLVLRKR